MKRNLVVGIASSIWTALIGLAVVPFYLKYMGVEAYGLIGFFATVQALLQLLDFGLTPTVNREVARHAESAELSEARALVRTLALVYWAVGLLVALGLALLAPLIASHWLQSRSLPPATLEHAVLLMGVVAACRWPIGLYQGTLIGMQRQMDAGIANIIMATVGSVGAVSVLALVSPTIQAFFVWQAIAALLNVALVRWMARRALGGGAGKFDLGMVKRLWRFSVGMSGVALTGLVFTQLDKVMLSKMLGLAEFGHYVLATAVVSGLYFVTLPVYNVVYPRACAFVKSGDTERLTVLYRRGTRLFASILFPLALPLVVIPGALVHLWTGNVQLAESVGPVMMLLALGTALHSVMYFPYALQLAFGMPRLPLTINGILMVVLVPLLILLTRAYGAWGGAMAWLVLHVMYLILGTVITHRSLLKGVGTKWLLQDVGIPALVSAIVGAAAYLVTRQETHSVYVTVGYGAAFAGLALLLSLGMASGARRALRDDMAAAPGMASLDKLTG